MFTEPYNTSLLKHYPVEKLTHQLETNFIQDALRAVELVSREGEQPLDALYEVLPGNSSVDLMEAPKLFETRHGTKIAIDSRANVRVDREGKVVPVAPSDYKFAKREAILTYLWATQGTVSFSQLGVLPIRVYARWVSGALVHRLALDPLEEMRINILAAFFYLCNFSTEPLSEGQQLGVSSLIARALLYPVDKVVPVISAAGHIEDLKDLIQKIKTSEGASPRLESASVALLYTLLNGSWFGARKSNIVGSALEYPPTFLTMLLSAYTDRSYHSSRFADLAIRADKHQLSREFTLALNHLSRGFTDG
jgi:hypothetical protein